MSRKKTDKEFKREVYNLVEDEYEFLDKYVNAITKIRCKHNKCGYVWQVRPTHFISLELRCPECGKHKKTSEKFLKEVKKQVGNRYTFLEKYNGAKTKIKFKHNICGYIYKVEPSSFLNGSRCPKCAGNMRRTTKQYKKEAKDLVGKEYQVIGNYVNSKTKIKMKHSQCGFEFEMTSGNFLSGKRCPHCMGKRISEKARLTVKEVKKRIQEKCGDEFVLLGNYKGIHKRTKIKHEECGFVWETTIHSLLKNKNKCPLCNEFKDFEKNNKTFLKEVGDITGNEYTFLEKYKKSHTKIKVRHNKCGYLYRTTPSNFLSGKRCPRCYGATKLTQMEFEKRTKDLYEDRYEVLGIYKNMKTKIKIKCNKCGYIFKINPNHFLSGHGCSCCNLSKGENLIEKWFKNNNIEYERQYSFDKCRYKNRLSFDFAVFEKSKLILLVEYDGVQHFKPIDFAGKGEKWASQRHEITKRKDEIKNDFCKVNNTPLLRIPHWDKELALLIIKQSLNKNKQLTFYNIY